jgi:2-(1,2-epoxy-1,2-dihydrophenyl)acetyl-CoA isomerase
MSFDTLRYEVEGGLARLTLNRPESMNGMTNQMVREARQALDLAGADPSIRVLVLTGAGRAFCPGADLKHFAGGGRDERLTSSDFRVTTLLHEIPAVTVAAINGACAGAGLGWALACDLRVMAASAKLNTAFLDVAVAGDMGLPWTLSRIVGAGRARELSLLPRKLNGEEAAAIGLVNAAFDDDTFRADVQAVVDALAAKAPIARRGMKAHYVAAEAMGFGEFVAMETKDHGSIIASEDCKEAFHAFVEKRPPRFQGK